LDDKGFVVGGLIGRTNEIPEWLEVSVIWVAEDKRGQGTGHHLMGLAEEEAKRRGCRYARLATGDYQAPDFYRRVGYRLYGKLGNCPRGDTVYYFYKELV
jgi:GNAT superfamily N-acetyltransferase